MSAIVMVLFFVFAIIVVGYLLGKINIKGVSLGTAAMCIRDRSSVPKRA